MKNFVCSFILFLTANLFAQNLKVGQTAPQIKITDKILNVPTDFNPSNKFVVVEFWATWCKPCLKAVPQLNQLEEKFAKNKNLLWLSITDENPLKVNQTLKKIVFKSIVVSDQTKETINKFIAQVDGSYSIPATILIDDKNIVRWIGTPDKLNEIVIQDFLNNRHVVTADSNEIIKIDKPIFRKQVDFTLIDFAYRLINNDSTQYAFDIVKNKRENNFLNLNYLASKKTYMDFNKYLDNLLANVNQINQTQVRIPNNLKNLNYSLFYKNLSLRNESDGLREIKNKIQEYFRLKERIEFIEMNDFLLELFDEKKLDGEPDQLSKDTKSSDDSFVFLNVELVKIVQEISNFYKINIRYKNGLNSFYKMRLQKGSIAKTMKSLQNYGFNLRLISQKTPVFVYEQ